MCTQFIVCVCVTVTSFCQHELTWIFVCVSLCLRSSAYCFFLSFWNWISYQSERTDEHTFVSSSCNDQMRVTCSVIIFIDVIKTFFDDERHKITKIFWIIFRLIFFTFFFFHWRRITESIEPEHVFMCDRLCVCDFFFLFLVDSPTFFQCSFGSIFFRSSLLLFFGVSLFRK